jgi:23S rRNA pseudouridine1911/1915/1917 synthase
MHELSVVVSDVNSDARRLDAYVASLKKGLTRSKLKAEAVSILLNSKKAKLSSKVKDGDSITVMWESPPVIFQAEDIPLDVLYEDSQVTVINKAQGMVTHPGAGNWTGTLVNALLFRWGRDASVALRPGIVHRLDKDTSGVMIAAKTDSAIEWLTAQFAAHRVKKEYIAIVTGRPKVACGHIKTLIARDTKNRKRFMVDAVRGKTAHTVYRCIACYGPFSLMKVRLKTGRTHQIRVHMKYLGCPVLGDPLYGSKSAVFPDASLMLHSRRLTIRLPGSKAFSVYKAPIPERFKTVTRELHLRYKKCVLP